MWVMSEEPDIPVDREKMPFVAPCRHVPASAPWYWLLEGFEDLRKAPLHSMGYGLFMAALIMIVTFLFWQYGSPWIMFFVLCGFVFVAPLSCIGIYAISAQLERNQPVSMKRTFRAIFKRHLGTEMVFALVLLVIFLIWARASSVISILLPETSDPTITELASYIAVFAVVAVLFLGITFCASIFALPMIMHRNVDAITAVLTSINSALHNKAAMLVWVLLISVGFVLGVLTAGLGLIPFLPAVGHGVWHGYQETIDVKKFPRHKHGITATARPPRGQPKYKYEPF
jgi:uncharacterized membrane protein